ncbi:hemolysin-III related-domain-containing protein [Pyronema omphalodes]|nr:hemolysin-III related-domain-containing protein [Pyronema omphalodes]
MSNPRKRRTSVGEKAVDAFLNVERKVEHALTCMWDDLQAWQKDNHYIIRGYRPESRSLYKCFASITYLHNETINIYTHLLAAVYFLWLVPQLHSTIAPRYSSSTTDDITAFSTFFLSAVICLGLSATYHTICNHSLPVAKFGNQLDYLGIIVLIVGSYLPTLHYGFMCRRDLVWRYWSMMGFLGGMCAIVTLIPMFRTPAWRSFRATMFVFLGGSGFVPVLHGLSLYGWDALNQRMGLNWCIIEGLLYVTGAVIYAMRVPEKFYPGRFDLVGASHQIFHCFVVAAALAHFKGLVVAFDFLHGIRGGVGCDIQ